MHDLRNAPIYKARANYSPYVSPRDTVEAGGGAGWPPGSQARPTPGIAAPHPKTTAGLPLGTQAKFIAAADAANVARTPLNHLLSVHWDKLFTFEADAPCLRRGEVERIGYLVELLRHWITERCRVFAYIWVREISASAGQHWHLALHLPKRNRRALLAYLERLLGEPLAPRRRALAQGRTEGEVACSVNGSWHLARDTHPDRRGYWLAAYLGKGEPSWRMFRGKVIANARKPVRGDKYDAPQGEIEGTVARMKRFDIARHLKGCSK
jgi:hypothetical protein